MADVLQPVNKRFEVKSGQGFFPERRILSEPPDGLAGSRPTSFTYTNKGFWPDFRQTNFASRKKTLSPAQTRHRTTKGRTRAWAHPPVDAPLGRSDMVVLPRCRLLYGHDKEPGLSPPPSRQV